MRFGWFLVAGSIAGLTATGHGQLNVNAGPDLVQDISLPFQLNGTVTGQRPFDYWMGDGDFATENQLVSYTSANGFQSSQDLTEITTQTLAGWPSDVVEINGDYYGVETGNRYLWKLIDFTTGQVQQIGPNFTWPWVTCLAYDKINDKLYGVDGNMKQLLLFDYNTGAVTPLGPPLSGSQSYYFIKGLAYDETSGLLYAIEDNTETVFTIDPATSATNYVMDVPSGPDLYDELQFYDGWLYASFKTWDTAKGWYVATVRRIDLVSGLISDRGPQFDHMSPHTLVIRSFPEEVEWRQISGPAQVTFATPDNPTTAVTIPTPGTYVLELCAFGNVVVNDQVQIDALGGDCNGNGVEDITDIALGTSLDVNANGVPDECEAFSYCTAKTNSLGCTPAIFASGTPSMTSPSSFDVGADQVLNQRSGLLFYGYASFVLPGFQGGTLCVQPPLRRLAVQNSGGTTPPTMDCSGQYLLDFNAHAQSGLDPLLVAGQQVNCQWWSRDPQQTDGTGAGLTDALVFTMQP